jgi:hypothetical protein
MRYEKYTYLNPTHDPLLNGIIPPPLQFPFFYNLFMVEIFLQVWQWIKSQPGAQGSHKSTRCHVAVVGGVCPLKFSNQGNDKHDSHEDIGARTKRKEGVAKTLDLQTHSKP